jgi:hypothetical protein
LKAAAPSTKPAAADAPAPAARQPAAEPNALWTQLASLAPGRTGRQAALPGGRPPPASLMGRQAKLEVSMPGDRHELEADRIADRVVARQAIGPIGSISPRAVPRKCAKCQEELHPLQLSCDHCGHHGGGEPAPVRPAAAAPGLPAASPISHLGGGEPLPAAARLELEGSFGQSFSGVRIHRSPEAAATAGAFDARAFTYGDNIVFGRGQFDPASGPGRHLLAHEMTHVVQQRGGDASLGIQRAPLGVARGIAGNCIGSGDDCSLGTSIHRFIQRLMIGLYSPAMFAEVAIPGGGSGTSCTAPGYIDLYGSLPIGIVPAVPQGHMFPPPVATFPVPARVPGQALLGSIKPFTMPSAIAHADLNSYLLAFDAFVAASGSPLSVAQPMRVPTQPGWAVPGLPFPFAPASAPQMMHVFGTLDGMYWYFCRPMFELSWLAARAAKLVADMFDELSKSAREVGRQLAYAFQLLAAALSAIGSAISQFLEEWGNTILAILAVIIVVILIIAFWEVIVALILAAGAALAKMGAVLAGAAAFAALLLLLLPSEAQAAETRNMPTPPNGIPDIPRPAPGGASDAEVSNGLRQLLQRLQSRGGQSQSPEAGTADILLLIDEAERTLRLMPGGDLLVYVLELLKHLLEELRQQSSLQPPTPPPGYRPPQAGGAAPPQGGATPPPQGGATPPPPQGGATPPPPQSGATPPPQGGATPPPPQGGATPPPQSGAAPPSQGGDAPAQGGATPPQGGAAPQAGGRSLGSGGGSAGSGGSGTAAPANIWPIIYEEIGTSRHFQILPDSSVANGTLSIVQPTNSGAVLRVVAQPDRSLVLQNTTMNNRVVAVVVPSSLISGGFQLVSGEMFDSLSADFEQWRRRNRRPRLDDLVYPQLHFR